MVYPTVYPIGPTGVRVEKSSDVMSRTWDYSWLHASVEMSDKPALWFSESGDRLSYITFNDTAVPEIRLPIYSEPDSFELYTEQVIIRYPTVSYWLLTILLSLPKSIRQKEIQFVDPVYWSAILLSVNSLHRRFHTSVSKSSISWRKKTSRNCAHRLVSEIS